jgi:hypothetical protein
MKEFEDEWNINNSDDDIDDKSGEKSDNSDNVRDNGIKKQKKRIVDPITGLKYKRIKFTVDGSIKFEECQIFTNITHFKEVLR